MNVRFENQHKSSTSHFGKTNSSAQPKGSHRITTAPFAKSGEGGIRTPGTVAGTPVFETGTIGHSVTSPEGK